MRKTEIYMKVIFSIELNPRLKNNSRYLKNWELLPLATCIKNRPMMEETEFLSSDSAINPCPSLSE